MKHCPQCDAKLDKKAKFCSGCGTAIATEENDSRQAEKTKNKTVLVVLSTLLLMALVAIGVLVAVGYDGAKEFFNGKTFFSFVGDFSDNPDRIANAAKCVVKLNCYNDKGALVGTGSGFSVFEEGVIVTNYHVIEGYPARIEIETESGQKCDIFGGIAVSEERDIAILYYQNSDSKIDLPHLTVASPESLKKGEKVVAIGSPLGLTNTVSTGVFSGYAKIGNSTDIQFTASISNGSSGGALFNNDGEVIGITYASIEAGQNLNFAVPIEFVKSLWENAVPAASSLNDFYESLIPHYTVDYVLKNYKELSDTIFYLDCWYSSYGKTEEGCIVFCGDSYEDIYNPNENNPETRFSKDTSRYSEANIIKIANFGSGFFAENYVEILFRKRGEKKSVKCRGTGWSAADNKPYALILR